MGSTEAGEMVIDNLSEEIVNWIKDTIVMLVKHHGNVDGYEFKEYGLEETMIYKLEAMVAKLKEEIKPLKEVAADQKEQISSLNEQLKESKAKTAQ
jgi:predicted nucleotidyltransferase